MKIMDGNTACSNVAYLFSENCFIYPITPSSPMAENIDNLTSTSKLNYFGSKPKVVEMQSEAGAAGALHGSLITGSLASTFTASQGLLLMMPNMFKMAGEMLPGVIHVASRSLATQSLSIFGDHQDIYAVRSTGFCMLASTNVYDAQNLAAVAHLSAIEGSLPFIHFFDGFRTSHEMNTINEIDEKKLKKLINKKKLEEYRNRVLYVGQNKQYGMAENEDIYFQSMEARNGDYLNIPSIVDSYMKKINEIMGTDYKPFNYYGSRDAEYVVVAMGSVCDTIKITIDELIKKGLKVGLIEVHLYRPFSKEYLLKVLPKSTKRIAVLDRTKEAGATGEPLYLDILSTLNDTDIKIYGGRYGLSSKNTTPSDINGLFDMLINKPFNNFTLGIVDDVTKLSVKSKELDVISKDTGIKIFGFGSDGMVSASKDLLKILNEENNSFVQGYFEYDSKKSGGVTISHLRVSKVAINKPYYVENPLVTVVTKLSYFSKFNVLQGVLENGILLINTEKDEDEINLLLPEKVKEIINKKNITVKYIDANKIALECGIKNKISKIMEVAILYLLGHKDSFEILDKNIRLQFKNKGNDVIDSNIKAIRMSLDNIKDLKLDNKSLKVDNKNKNVYEKINARLGNYLKVSDCMEIKDGGFKNGLTQYEKRNVTNMAPVWNKDACIQCGQCSIVCPHAAIRTFISKDKTGIPLLGNDKYNFEVLVSEADCLSCGLCSSICPGKGGVKALTMEVKKGLETPAKFRDYENPDIIDKSTIKGSQLQKPLFEFSGSCAGCGETPYIKLLTQVVGKKLVIANATGCSSIYGGSAPSTPYLIPWANSLFEDNAEFSMGMYVSLTEKRNRLENVMLEKMDDVTQDIQKLFKKWLKNKDDYEITMDIKNKLLDLKIPTEVKELINYVPAHSVWAIGGDGWAYDIGYGGLDHILHSNENINILVLDTEVYSNTGGQSSKATSLGAVAKFNNSGKRTLKKDLFKIAMNIPNCYVASISLGANMFQAIKTFKEAEEHNGPSIVIAYSPCIEQGIKSGMGCSIQEEKLAVQVGYTILMRYNPDLDKLFIDSKEPDFDNYMNLLDNEVRFNSLKIKDKKLAKELLEEQKEYARKRYEYYKKMTE